MKKFNPDIYVENIYNINFDLLKKKRIKLLCFDLDNTLDEPDTISKLDKKLLAFFQKLEKDFEILIVSNNKIAGRVESFATIYNLNFIKNMRKPFQKNYNNDIISKYKKDEIVFIGDKIITDVLGAKIYGSYSILVDPLFPKKIWYNQVMSYLDKATYFFTCVRKNKYFNNLES